MSILTKCMSLLLKKEGNVKSVERIGCNCCKNDCKDIYFKVKGHNYCCDDCLLTGEGVDLTCLS